MIRSMLTWMVALVLVFGGGLALLSMRSLPEKIDYGLTFSTLHAKEIGLDWKAAYLAMFDDLGVRRVRLIAYWPEVEPERDGFDWSDLDFQIHEAELRGVDVILAIGRRVPRWPECHVPHWVGSMPWEEQKREIRQLLTAIIERYRNSPAVSMWQVENEPFIPVFGGMQCGELDRDFLAEEIVLVHELDERPVLLTDGGNFGLWAQAYRMTDVFGTSMYLYFWRPDIGIFKTILPPSYYRVKARAMELLFGTKPIILSELSLEPWLAASIEDVAIDEQINRMNVPRMQEILAYAAETSFATQYVWGVEWWYWMREQGHPEFWDFAMTVFRK